MRLNGSLPELFQVREASAAVFRDSPDLLAALNKMTQSINEESNSLVAAIIGAIALMLTLVSLIMLIRLRASQDRERAEAEKALKPIVLKKWNWKTSVTKPRFCVFLTSSVTSLMAT